MADPFLNECTWAAIDGSDIVPCFARLLDEIDNTIKSDAALGNVHATVALSSIRSKVDALLTDYVGLL